MNSFKNSRIDAAVQNIALASQERFQKAETAQESTNYLAAYHQASLASKCSQILKQQIEKFDESLDDEHEVGMKLVTFGQSITFHVETLGYQDPILIFFSGVTDEGNPVHLTQHISQLSFLLISLPRLNPEQPKRKIGFVGA